jgi:hypothetical protein
MGDLNPGEIFALVCGLVLAAAGFINTVGSAMEKIAKARKAAQAPNEAQNQRLHELEEYRKELDDWRKEVNRKLHNDNDQLLAVNECMRVLLQGQLALLDHGIDGNNIKQMQDAKEVLQHHLINNK